MGKIIFVVLIIIATAFTTFILTYNNEPVKVLCDNLETVEWKQDTHYEDVRYHAKYEGIEFYLYEKDGKYILRYEKLAFVGHPVNKLYNKIVNN